VNESQFKIFYENLVYVPNLTQCISLLTRSRLYSYRKAIDVWNRDSNPKITAKQKMVQENSHPASPPTGHEKILVAD
jgi:hypothetical protein